MKKVIFFGKNPKQTHPQPLRLNLNGKILCYQKETLIVF